MVSQSTTHDLDIRDDIVIKRYTAWSRGEPRREWAALTLLMEHAPGLAPMPIEADLDATPPTIVMSRLPGIPLRGTSATGEQIAALASALAALHHAVPGPVVQAMQPAAWNPAAALAKARTWAAKQPDLGRNPHVLKAFAAGSDWLTSDAPDHLLDNPLPPVLGLSDGNLANYLWDAAATRVHIIDWEDSGCSDRAFELAELLEHISHLDGAFDAEQLLAHLELTQQEDARVHDFRRLLALGWFLMLGPEGPFALRNPAGTLERLAERVLHLLN